MADKLHISGGAGPEQAAAIAAVVARIEADERAAAATRPRPIHKTQWSQAGRPLERMAPVPPSEYNKKQQR
ncbi:MAG: hypothetical protein ACC654_00690 [Acidimicrobiia bacterium]